MWPHASRDALGRWRVRTTLPLVGTREEPRAQRSRRSRGPDRRVGAAARGLRRDRQRCRGAVRARPERAALDAARDAGRLRVAVLATAADPGDGVRPGAELVVNTLSLDPSLYGHDAPQARERFSALRRPFAFPLDAEQAARAPGLPAGYLAVVSREPFGEPRRGRCVRGARRRAGSRWCPARPCSRRARRPEPLRATGLANAAALRAALVGRIACCCPTSAAR